MMYLKTQADIELEQELAKQEKELRKIFSANYKTQQATLELFEKSIKHCDFNNFKDNRIIWNLAGYINIVSYDLKLVGENLFFYKDEWAKRFFARQSALIIYEAINDIPALSGKKFRTLLESYSDAPQLKEDLKELMKAINDYKRKNFKRLQVIRHNCAAHRDQDCIEQLKIIAEINWSESIGYVTQFDTILMNYGKFMQKVIDISLAEAKELVKAKE